MSTPEVVHKPLTRGQADAKRQAEGEAAFRSGFLARVNRDGRNTNPFTLVFLLDDARRMVMYPGTSQQRPYTEAEVVRHADSIYPQVEHQRNCWYDGWDTAQRVADVKGEAALPGEMARLLTPAPEAKPRPPRFADQDALFSETDVPAEKKRRRETDWERLRKWTGKSEAAPTTPDEA